MKGNCSLSARCRRGTTSLCPASRDYAPVSTLKAAVKGTVTEVVSKAGNLTLRILVSAEAKCFIVVCQDLDFKVARALIALLLMWGSCFLVSNSQSEEFSILPLSSSWHPEHPAPWAMSLHGFVYIVPLTFGVLNCLSLIVSVLEAAAAKMGLQHATF